MSALHRLLGIVVCVTSLLTGIAHAQSFVAQRENTKLRLSGSSLLQPLMTDVARRFQSTHPGVTFDIRTSGSREGVADVRKGAADVAMLSRAVLRNERDLFAFHLARDGVAVIVNRSNPVSAIRREQLAQLLTGEIRNWKNLGGKNELLTLGWRSRGQGSVEFVLDYLGITREQIGPHTAVRNNSDAIEFVSTRPDAVALASVGIAEQSAADGTPIKLLAYNGTAASSRNLQNRRYELSRPLTLLTAHLPQGLQKEFVDFALSNAVTDLQVKHGFVPYQD